MKRASFFALFVLFGCATAERGARFSDPCVVPSSDECQAFARAVSNVKREDMHRDDARRCIGGDDRACEALSHKRSGLFDVCWSYDGGCGDRSAQRGTAADPAGRCTAGESEACVEAARAVDGEVDESWAWKGCELGNGDSCVLWAGTAAGRADPVRRVDVLIRACKVGSQPACSEATVEGCLRGSEPACDFLADAHIRSWPNPDISLKRVADACRQKSGPWCLPAFSHAEIATELCEKPGRGDACVFILASSVNDPLRDERQLGDTEIKRMLARAETQCAVPEAPTTCLAVDFLRLRVGMQRPALAIDSAKTLERLKQQCLRTRTEAGCAYYLIAEWNHLVPGGSRARALDVARQTGLAALPVFAELVDADAACQKGSADDCLEVRDLLLDWHMNLARLNDDDFYGDPGEDHSVEDTAMAKRALERACAVRVSDCTTLGSLNLDPRGSLLDLKAAEQAFDKGCKGEDVNGCTRLAELQQLRAGCAENRVETCAALAGVYLSADASAENKREGARLLEIACDRTRGRVCVDLGELYYAGERVPHDFAKAKAAYSRFKAPPPEARLRDRRIWDIDAIARCEVEALACSRSVEVLRPSPTPALEAVLKRHHARACSAGSAESCFATATYRLQDDGHDKTVAQVVPMVAKHCEANQLLCLQFARELVSDSPTTSTAERNRSAAALFEILCANKCGSACNRLGELLSKKAEGIPVEAARAAKLLAVPSSYTDACMNR